MVICQDAGGYGAITTVVIVVIVVRRRARTPTRDVLGDEVMMMMVMMARRGEGEGEGFSVVTRCDGGRRLMVNIVRRTRQW